MSDIIYIARERAAWFTPNDTYTPDLGDSIIVGAPNHEHVYTIVSLDGDESEIITSIDGGQGSKGANIARCMRKLEIRDDDKLYDIRTDMTIVRPVIGFIDVTAIGIPGLEKSVTNGVQLTHHLI